MDFNMPPLSYLAYHCRDKKNLMQFRKTKKIQAAISIAVFQFAVQLLKYRNLSVICIKYYIIVRIYYTIVPES